MKFEAWMLIATALGTFLAALAAMIGARATAKSSRGQLISQLYNEYWSGEYLDAALTVRSWQKKWGDNYAKKYGEMRRKKDTLSLKEIKEFESIDNARRQIKGYFRKSQQLYSECYLKKTDVKKLLCPPHRVELLLNVIETFEPEIDPDYTHEMYDFFRRY